MEEEFESPQRIAIDLTTPTAPAAKRKLNYFEIYNLENDNNNNNSPPDSPNITPRQLFPMAEDDQ